MTYTFEEARRELSKLTAALNGNRIDMDAWCLGVHDVIAAFQKGQAERSGDPALVAAVAAPREANAAKNGAVQSAARLAHRDAINRHSMTGHGL